MAITGRTTSTARFDLPCANDKTTPKKSARSSGNPPSNTPHEWVATFGLINPVHQIACGHKFLYLLSERYQFATVRRVASFA